MNWLKKLLGIRSPSLVAIRDCRECKHKGRWTCPNSSFCYDTIDKPYFEWRQGKPFAK